MALPLCCNAKLQPLFRSSSHYEQQFHFFNHRDLRFSWSTEVSISSKRISYRLAPLKSSSINGFSVEKNLERFEEEHSVENVELRERIQKWIVFLRSVLPGGSWWSFFDDVELKLMAKLVTVWWALSGMWQLIANDRLVIFDAFSTLIVAAVKRMRETQYSALLLQDISFFDGETVGDLTSSLGSDCQQVSGNRFLDLLADFVMATWFMYIGDMLYSSSSYAGLWPVAQETFSLMRIVRVYGTEKQKLKRYNHWLDKLADISLWQSAAYGVSNLSFNTLYHSTQLSLCWLEGCTFLLVIREYPHLA